MSFTERCALACHGDLLKLSMFFRVNVIGVAIDVFLFSHVFIYFLLLFWCTVYRVGKSIMYETLLIYLSFSRAFNV